MPANDRLTSWYARYNNLAYFVARRTTPVVAARLDVKPIDTQSSFRTQAYHALKQAITSVNIYAQPHEIRLDERQLSQDLGVSRTPIREAMTLLEQEGFVKTLPRRGIFVVRKTKREIIELIEVWAAFESIAARLITLHASDAEIASLRHVFDEFQGEGHSPEGHLDEYSDANIRFHQALIRMSGNRCIADMTENLFIHMRAIRQMTIRSEEHTSELQSPVQLVCRLLPEKIKPQATVAAPA